jgi:hypothetical protein
VALAVSIYRAATQSITHDEARVFLLYMQGSVRHAFAYTGIQNHVLQAVLSRLMLTWLPASAFVIRIPTLLAAVLFCAAVVAICERLFDDRWMCWTVVALMTLHPYTLDFLSAARGYGLMLAFLLVATALVVPGVISIPESIAHAAAGVSLGLAIAATTACLFAVAGIVFAAAMSYALSRRWRDGVVRIATLCIVAAIVAAIPLANQLYRATGSDYQLATQLGSDSFLLEAASLIRASVSRGNPYLTTMGVVTRGQVAALVIAAMSVVAAVVLAIARLSRWTSLEAADRALVWLVTMLTGTVASTVGAHLLMHVTYPQARMALYWIPFVTLAIALAWSRTRAGSVSRVGGWAVALLVVVVDLSLLDVTTYADWKPDAPDAALVDNIVNDHRGSGRQVTVGGSWVLEPSMNFYRVTRRLDWMRPMERRPPDAGDDYYVLVKEDRATVDRLRLHVLYDDSRTGTLAAATSAARADAAPSVRRIDDPSGRSAASAAAVLALRVRARSAPADARSGRPRWRCRRRTRDLR